MTGQRVEHEACDVQASNTCDFPSPDMSTPTSPFLCVQARKTGPPKGPFLSNNV